ncbi:tail assembly protein [Leminorella grimontii]|uniref:Tail assembly protein n=3 Tax=Leminorella grimontii TaxID=82981 RepID=A0AAV5N817_9GAMM|nr:tail fiber assembly protein [Leminorella grimontii]KFC92438.1 tail fiber assembly protein [Leminorella grimontii ATCC 33999 = DSM 5078]GKX57603.1 tail assembly protein [Leminorella grimontii]VFS55821.1 Bacteriophage tail assembly protein [Leminorella grimontii]VFS62680.1 Bacteriophage tail assembly protein [Leminorella grimontii]
MERAKLNSAGLAESAGFVHVYHTSPVSGEFIRESDEFLSVGVGIPAYSYIDEPLPFKDGFAVCRSKQSWEYIEDHRGAEAYSTQTRAVVEITALGPLPADVTTIKPETAFDLWDGQIWVTDEAAAQQVNIEVAEAEKAQRLRNADVEIERLKDAVNLDMATDEESALYTEWRKYRVLLNRVDTSKAPNIEWPTPPIAG